MSKIRKFLSKQRLKLAVSFIYLGIRILPDGVRQQVTKAAGDWAREVLKYYGRETSPTTYTGVGREQD